MIQLPPQYYALLLLEENMNTEGYLKFRTILFTAAVVLFQHRSVWMAWGCGFIVILLISMKDARITKKLFFQLLLLTVFCFIVLNMGSGQLSENISKSFCEDNAIYGKFTDQDEVSIDEVVTDFKLLDF